MKVTAWDRLERIKPLLWCPHCHGDLAFDAAKAVCGGCAAQYPIRDGRIFFCQPLGATDELDGVKLKLRRLLERHYRTIADVVAPDFPVLRKRELHRTFDPKREIVLDVGCGSQRLDENIIGLDIVDYESADVICDVHAMPFRPGSVDGAVSWGVLEHLRDPFTVIANLRACTRAGGRGLHMVPFMYPFHASPDDFLRFSHEGVKVLFDRWTVRDVRNSSGPVSFLLLGLVELFSVLLSFGSPRLKGLAYLALCGLTFPIKILDVPFLNRKSLRGMAPTLVVEVSNPADDGTAVHQQR